MFEPFMFVSTHAIEEDKLERLEELSRTFVEFVEANEPRPIAVHVYINEDHTELSMVQIHPDADSMKVHLQVAGDRIGEAVALAPTTGIEVHGTPGTAVQEVLRRNAESGVPVSVKAQHVAGFTRHATR